MNVLRARTLLCKLPPPLELSLTCARVHGPVAPTGVTQTLSMLAARIVAPALIIFQKCLLLLLFCAKTLPRLPYSIHSPHTACYDV
jgi:hypothetical protein